MPNKITPYEEVKGTLANMDVNFQATLPASIPSDKFRQTVMIAIQNNPKILDANRKSLYIACMQAASDGLVLDGKEAALVPFKGQVKYMPMAHGIVKKILSTGMYTTVQAEVVCENDEFESFIDEKGAHWKHVKARSNRGKPQLAYAYAISKEGGTSYEEMNTEEVMAVKKVAKTGMIWDGDFGNEMWRKSALRRLAKKLLTSNDIASLFANDDGNYDMEAETPEPVNDGSTAASRVVNAASEAEVVDDAPPMF